MQNTQSERDLEWDKRLLLFLFYTRGETLNHSVNTLFFIQITLYTHAHLPFVLVAHSKQGQF